MYARTVSSIDHWLGKILIKIDIEKTLLVITGDHGERIPFDDKGYSDFQPKFNSAPFAVFRFWKRKTENGTERNRTERNGTERKDKIVSFREP